jgi:hypothetical protein
MSSVSPAGMAQITARGTGWPRTLIETPPTSSAPSGVARPSEGRGRKRRPVGVAEEDNLTTSNGDVGSPCERGGRPWRSASLSRTSGQMTIETDASPEEVACRRGRLAGGVLRLTDVKGDSCPRRSLGLGPDRRGRARPRRLRTLLTRGRNPRSRRPSLTTRDTRAHWPAPFAPDRAALIYSDTRPTLDKAHTRPALTGRADKDPSP